MRILLAGGAGYIGSILAPALVKYGYEITVIDLLFFGNYLPKNIKVIQKDLFRCTQDDLREYDQIIFLAGISNDPMAEYSPAKNFIYNGALPSYLAFIAKKAGIKRFIYASSCSVYGYAIDKSYTEDDQIVCDYPYGISKLQGERGVHQLQDHSFSVISLRQGTVCGFSPRMRMDLIVNTMFMTAMTYNSITINNPSIWRPIYHIQDAVDAFLRAIQADYQISGIFNVASENYTVGQIGDLVKCSIEYLSGSRIRLEIKNIKDFRNYKVSIERAKTILGFRPQYSINDIVSNLYENKGYYRDYDSDEYYNFRMFKKNEDAERRIVI